MTFRRTVIRSELSAWTCQPFCCQRAFALIPSERPSIPLRHLPRWLLPAIQAQSPFPNSSHYSLTTTHYPLQAIKNPASSAGLSHHTGDSARSSTLFYPVLVKNLTIGCTSGLRLILRWEDAASTRL